MAVQKLRTKPNEMPWFVRFVSQRRNTVILYQKGFSMIQAMVMIVFVGALGFAVAELNRNGFVGQKNLLASDDSLALTNAMRTLLQAPNACKNTFGGGNPASAGGFNLANIKDNAGGVQYAVNNIYGNRSLQLVNINVGGTAYTGGGCTAWPGHYYRKGPPVVDIVTWVQTGTVGTALVLVDWQQQRAKVNPASSPHYLHYFLIDVTLVGGVISTCQAEGTGTSAISGSALGAFDSLVTWQAGNTLAPSSIFQKVLDDTKPAFGYIGINGDAATNIPSYDLDVFDGVGVQGKMRVGAITGMGNINATGANITTGAIIKATDMTITSDKREKTKIKSLNTAVSLEKISAVRSVSFLWKSSGLPDEGVIAQELSNIFPELVEQDKDGHFSVRYTSLSAPIFASIQELNLRKDKLRAENQELRTRIEHLETDVLRLKSKK